jgi:hypothetical protein
MHHYGVKKSVVYFLKHVHLSLTSSSEFAIRWSRVWGFAIPYICCGFHGKRIFFGGKYSSFFGKTRKKCVCVSALQMLIFKAGGLQIRQN